VKPRLRGVAAPWLLAALACAGAFAAVHVLGRGQYRSEFLGGSLLLGLAGGLCWLIALWLGRSSASVSAGVAAAAGSARPTVRGARLRWLGLFLMNWLFAAYLISVLAI
jgi:hypothetical protein